MRTWMRRGIPAALLAGGVLAMTAGNAAAAPAPIGDPTGTLDTALRLTDLVGHKGLPPLPFASQIELPAMPIGQTQRDLDPAGLAGGGLSLSNVQLNGQDLPKPQLPGLPALPSLGGDQQRSIDPSHIAISDLPQLQQLPKLPTGLVSGLPVSVLPDVSTSRSLPNLTYSGAVPTGGLHSLTKLPDLNNVSELTQLSNPTQLPDVPQLPLGDDQQRSLPGLDLVGALPVGGLLGGAAAERDLPAVPGLPKLPLALPGLPAARDLPGLPAARDLPGLPAARDLPGVPALPQLPLALPGLGQQRSLPGLDVLSTLPLQGLLGVAGTERSLPGLDLLSTLPLQGLLGVAGTERSLPGLDLVGALPVGGLLGGAAAQRDLPTLPAVPGLDMVFGLVKSTPLAALLAGTPLSSVAGRDLPGLGLLSTLPVSGLLGGATDATDAADTDAVDTDARSLPAIPALPKLPLAVPGVGAQQRSLPVVDSLLPKLPLAVPAVPGASVSGFHGIPALGPSFTTQPADDSARSIVPGLPSTPAVLGGLLGHAPRLPISGI